MQTCRSGHERLRHYFGTYKLIPGEEAATTIEQVYDCAHALKVVEAALQDLPSVTSSASRKQPMTKEAEQT